MKSAQEILDSKLYFAGAVKDRILEAMKEYAIAMCEEQKKACAEEADVEYRGSCFGDYIVDKQSILNTKNVAE